MSGPRVVPSEHIEQSALIRWARSHSSTRRELSMLFAIPNGGKRAIKTAKDLKAEGVQPGVPDLCLPVSRQCFHGLYIEMKSLKGRPSPEQEAWMTALRYEGYAVALCKGWHEARQVIQDYLGMKG